MALPRITLEDLEGELKQNIVEIIDLVRNIKSETLLNKIGN